SVPTRVVVRGTCTLDWPAGTSTSAVGNCTRLAWLVARWTCTPASGALPFRVSVAVAGLPPTTLDGSTVMPSIASGSTVRAVFNVVAPSHARSVARVDAFGSTVCNGTGTLEAPSGTRTV